ncbi:hypothetical protein F4825DRAFT_465157 [Nemania diffusa]|nr:hypothetical protein F4825DRAFT_465157 [Nemania diffusa]
MTINNNSHDHLNGTSSRNGNVDSNGDTHTNGCRTTRPSPPPAPPIAVVGMACRFAGDATSPEKLWELCAGGRDAWSPIPDSRFDFASLYEADYQRPGRHHVKGGYFLKEDVALFDAGFFNFTTDVANAMDPQLRQLLEVTYEATEDAGLPIGELSGPDSNTSVFVGCFTKDYHDLLTRDPETMPPSTLTGNYTAMFSNRISHFYDFRGPSMSIDTGCSAALVALHQGCQAIRSGESGVSIVGASNNILNPDFYIATSTLGMVGADGRCYAWDSRAQGYGRGEGVAVLVLKPLDAALRDGDRVHAVIRDTGLNQDGKTSTITSPSTEAQIRLINQCYQRAGLDLASTGYVEAHMTGTKVGDVAEAESLARTFGASRPEEDPVWIGSVKTNVGHTEGVSGLASIIKAAMAMKYRSIPPNQNYIEGNPDIPLRDWHLQVPTGLVPWPRNKPLRASVNNFGYGGTNAHVILEAAPENSFPNGHNNDRAITNGHTNGHTHDANESRLYVLSAQETNTAKVLAANLAAHVRKDLEGRPSLSMADLAYTLGHRRSRLSYVATVRARSLTELAENLEKATALKIAHVPSNKQSPRLGFVFNGQGAQWHAMGRELLSAYPVFDAAVNEADHVLREHGADWSLREELTRDAESTRVHEIHLGQPMTVALQICLVVLLRSWGIHPSAVTSHSSGEIAAAYAAGALSFEQALGVTFWRGELARTLLDPKLSGVVGTMAAGGVGPEEAERYAAGATSSNDSRVVVACINSPESVTFSGDADAVDRIVSLLDTDGKFARKLKVGLAYHSHHMLRMASAYLQKLRAIVPLKSTRDNQISYSSPVTGGVITPADTLSADYYVRNLTNPVRFSQALEAMCFDGSSSNTPSTQVDAIIEIGPHSALAGPIRQILRGRKMAYMSALERKKDAVETMQDLAGDLVRLGYPVCLDAVNHCPEDGNVSPRPKFLPDLPTYPWNHATRYWTESRVSRDVRHKKFPPHELLGLPILAAKAPSWRNFLRLNDIPWLGDHRVDGAVVLPGAAYLSMAMEAVRLVTDPSEKSIHGYQVRDVEFLGALAIPESQSSGGVETQLRLEPCSGEGKAGWYEFEVRSLGLNDVWVENCQGFVSAVLDDVQSIDMPDAGPLVGTGGVVAKGGRKTQIVSGASVRDNVASMGIQYGQTFEGVVQAVASKSPNKAAADLRIVDLEALSESTSKASSYVIHPTTLDCIFQSTYTNLPPNTGKTSMVLPRSLQHLLLTHSLHKQPGQHLTVFSELCKAQRRGFTSDMSVVNGRTDHSDGETPALVVHRLFCQAIPREAEDISPRSQVYHTHWEPQVSHNGFPTHVQDSMRITLADEEVDYEKKVVRACYYLASDALSVIKTQPSEQWTARHPALISWMEDIVSRGKSGQLMPGSKMWGRASKGIKQLLYDELKSAGGLHGSLIVRIGRDLVKIVRGEPTVSSLSEENGSDLQRQFLNALPGLQSRSHKQLATIVRSIAVEQPGAKILEIGAGSGDATLAVLKALQSGGNGGLLVDQYIVSDVSAELFEPAKKKLAIGSNVLEFRQLDVENEDPSASPNGLATHSLDVVITSMSLLAVKHLKTTLQRLRTLLKPSGKLLLIEPTQARLDTQLVIGTLTGWEANSEYPKIAMSVEAWDSSLRDSGFTGVELDIADCEQSQYRRLSVMLTGVTPTREESGSLSTLSSNGPSEIEIVCAKSALTDSQHNLIKTLAQEVGAKTGVQATVVSFEEVIPEEDKAVILATDIMGSGSLLDDIDETTFQKFRRLLLESHGVLWLTSGLTDNSMPAASQVGGLLRTLRQENADKVYATLDLTENWVEEDADMIAARVVRVVQQTILNNEDVVSDGDWEFAIRDSALHVPRIYPNLNSENETETDVMLPFHRPDLPPLVWEALPSGEGRFVEDDDRAASGLRDGVIEIETRAFGMAVSGGAAGSDEEDSTPIYEVSGIVARLGPDTQGSGLQIGDKVCGVHRGPYANRVHVTWTNLAKIPDTLSVENAVCFPLACSAAYYALAHHTRVRKDDRVLIVHASGEGDMMTALTLAKQAGADVWFAAVTLTEAEIQLLQQTHQVASDRILDAKGMVNVIAQHTSGRGVDVVLTGPTSSLPPHLLQSAVNSVAPFGRFVEIGSSLNKNFDVAQLSTRCVTYARVDVMQLAERNGLLFKEILDTGLRTVSEELSSSSRSHPTLSAIKMFAPSEMDRAIQHQRQKGNSSKVVVVANKDDGSVKVGYPSRQLRFNSKEGSYLVIGNVDGIGGTIASWLVSRGASNVVVVSRNAKTNPQAAALQDKATMRGGRLHVMNCDVSSEESLVALLSEMSSSLPIVRGVIHAANVAADTVFENMSFSQWQQTVRPKVAGTRHLHRHLPCDLDFFVLLSSLIGVAGNVSQANYASANAFQDALAMHRASLGLVASSIALPAITGIGMIASDEDAHRRVETLGSESIDMEEILRLIENAIQQDTLTQRRNKRSSAGLDHSPANAQKIVGLKPWANLSSESAIRRDRRFGTLRLVGTASSSAGSLSTEAKTLDPSTLLVRALGDASSSGGSGAEAKVEGTSKVAEALAARLAAIFNIDTVSVDLEAPVSALGVDSLVAVEVRTWLASKGQAKLSMFEVLQSPSLNHIAEVIISRSKLVSK